MSNYNPDEIAEQIQSMSVSLIEAAFSAGNAAIMLQQSQEDIRSLATSLQDLVNTLPPEVKERLEYINLQDKQKMSEGDAESLIDIIRKMLNGGN